MCKNWGKKLSLSKQYQLFQSIHLFQISSPNVLLSEQKLAANSDIEKKITVSFQETIILNGRVVTTPTEHTLPNFRGLFNKLWDLITSKKRGEAKSDSQISFTRHLNKN